MSLVRARTLVLVLSLAALASKPAAAQEGFGSPNYLGNWPTFNFPDLGELAVSLSLISSGLYVGLGTVGFIAADVHYVAHEKPMPPGLAVAQGVFGATVIAAGGACVTYGVPEGAALVAVGGGLIAAPLVDWGIRGARRPHRTAVRLSPTGVLVSGTF